MLADILRASFLQARHRAGVVVLDFLWKAVWLVCTVAAVFLVAAWFGSELRDLAWEDTGVRTTNMLIAMAALREFWHALRGEVLLAVLLLIAASAIAWFLLEALVHSRIIDVAGGDERGLRTATTYLISRVTKAAVLTVAGLILFLVCVKGAPILAIVLFLGLVLCLTLIETLIRADAVELLGTDLIRVTALIGILMSFEMMIAASFVVILAAGFLNVARLSDALAMLGLTGITAVFLSAFHSYLLLVRFSAVGIMRQNVVAA
jgi:hypothetical protein